MFKWNLSPILLCKHANSTKLASQRNVQVSIIGCTNDTGSNLALLMKQNYNIKKINLYDDDERVKGIATELMNIPGGPLIDAYAGPLNLGKALKSSELVLMVYRIPRKPGQSREDIFAVNAPAIRRLCQAIAQYNPTTFLAIATNPINSMVPFASALLYKYGCYNPFKVVGITQIDRARCCALVANTLQVSTKILDIPVIGGHSEKSIVPLFSNTTPASLSLNPQQIVSLTRVLRKAGTEIVFKKQGVDSATLGMASSINDFAGKLVEALRGNKAQVNCFMANPNFRTKFFGGPTIVGSCGVVQSCPSFKMNEQEHILLDASVPVINKEVDMGENYIQVLETGGYS